MKASYLKYTLQFKQPGGTSRGVLTQKDTYFIVLEDTGQWGIGETGLFRGLSYDDRPDYEAMLALACKDLETDLEGALFKYQEYPSIVFGMEQAVRSFQSPDPFCLFPDAPFLNGDPIPINGLIWMGDIGFMKAQIADRLKQGFTCLKLKIGALNFEEELRMLSEIRSEFGPADLEIRVDANGAFPAGEALLRLKHLAALDLHSIEQPIAAGQPDAMAELCTGTPLPIALDEELIGCIPYEDKSRMLKAIRPQYIILKPSLVGGFSGSEEWIRLAEELRIGWWVTSALESNIGLNAIAQWTSSLDVHMPQGLGTGSLFTNNISSPLEVAGGALRYDFRASWDVQKIQSLCI
ncbi:o-succinylbenzoate synthase [Robiginitalea aurantiaca]|uniref:O-succinylbenzoate synthase n=1 Tax=Robiginitalea aurantiaca TaxID=3056915 RepID=A0ABT7WG44_9FLAO|nr:o-succinylbenzoate synthase [Robiginitalea aurantiaca]MDM9631890.1 o-succinylbenzoate synthase [Robiginitalea aurantiaca]